MTTCDFTIFGEPRGKQRPRFLKNTGGSYTPKETTTYENMVRHTFVSCFPGHRLFEGPVRLAVVAYFAIPKSASIAKKKKMVAHETPPTKKPDWDNVGKIVSDALNSIAYHDDSQIVTCLVLKRYGERPRVRVRLRGETHAENTNPVL